jgi:hypothetical protein
MPSTLACVVALLPALLRAAPITHEFLAIDEGLGNLLHVDEADPSRDWRVAIGRPHPRDLQLEGGGRLLMSTDLGYREYALATGRLLHEVEKYHDVSSARRLPDGHLLLAGVDLDRPKQNQGDLPLGDPTGRHVIVAEFDEHDAPVRRTAYVGDYLRLMRETAAGTFLFSCNTVFREGDAAGNTLHEFRVEGLTHAWKAVRLPNGHTLMSSGYGTTQRKDLPPARRTPFMAEVDAGGREVRRFGSSADVPSGIHPYFYAFFQLLPNGDVVVANWQGHGPGHGGAGVQLLEFDRSGAVVWRWNRAETISSIQAVLVLDGLDANRLHDERNGLMAPLLP